MAYRPARSGSEGNTKLLKQYGGGSTPPRQHYATGGAVKGGNPSLSEGLSASGSPAKPSLARPGRKMPSKSGAKKGGKTNVNVIIMGKGEEKPPMPPMAEAGPPMPMPPGPPPGGPPMPMRASGGRVKRQDGGSTISEDSKAEAKKLREREASAESGQKLHTGLGAASLAMSALPFRMGTAARAANLGAAGFNAAAGVGQMAKKYKNAAEAERIEKGKVKEGEEDRKKGGRVCRAPGGPVGGLSNKQGGAGGASGRLAKIKAYGK